MHISISIYAIVYRFQKNKKETWLIKISIKKMVFTCVVDECIEKLGTECCQGKCVLGLLWQAQQVFHHKSVRNIPLYCTCLSYGSSL